MKHHLLTLVCLLFITYPTKSAFGQNRQDGIEKTSKNQKRSKEFEYRKSIDLELLTAGFQFSRFNGRNTSIGLGLGVGMGLTNWVVLAGNTFVGKRGILYEDENVVRRTKLTIEYFNAKLFIQRNVDAGDFEFGLRYAYTVLIDDGGAEGHFIGAYIQPMLGNGRVQYGFRINAGSYKAYEIDTEFGISINPLILRINFFREKNNRTKQGIPNTKFIYPNN